MTTDGREDGGTSPYVSDLELAQRLMNQTVREPIKPISASDALADAKKSPFASDMELAKRIQEQEQQKSGSST
jgi:hypothetical protein